MSKLTKTEIDVNKILEVFPNCLKEIRRDIMGKNSGTKINFNKSMTIYNTNCNVKFNFQIDGNRCPCCNSFSLLTSDGILKTGTTFKIENGPKEGKELILSTYPRQSDIGNFNVISKIDTSLYKLPMLDLCSNLFSDIFKYSKVINQDSEIYYYIAISSILNYIFNENDENRNTFTIKLQYTYACSNLHVIDLKTSKLQDIYIDPNIAVGIFSQLVYFFTFLHDNKYYFSHGSPEIKYLSFDLSHYQHNYGNLNINCPISLVIEPCKYSSILYSNYRNSKYHIVNNYNPEGIDKVPVYFTFEETTFPKCKSTASQCLPEYSEKRSFYYILDKNIIKYIKQCGFSLFYSLDLYLFFAALLLEEKFYISFSQSNIFDKVCNVFFFQEQKEEILSKIKLHHENKTAAMNATELEDFFINLQIKMRCNIFSPLITILSDHGKNKK